MTFHLHYPGTQAASGARRRSFARWLVVAALGASLCVPTLAHADAREDFTKAQELYEQGQFASALALFKSVYQETVSPNARLYMARSLRELGDLVDAYEEMATVAEESALRAETEPKYAGTRDAAAAELAQLRRQIGRVTIAVEGHPDGLEIRLADKPITAEQLADEIAVKPGTIELVASAPGYQTIEKTLEVDAGDEETVAVALRLVEANDDGAGDDHGENFFESLEIGPIRGSGIAVTGVGVVAGVIFVVTGLSSQSKYDDISTSCNNTTCPESFNDAIDDGKSLETIANVSLVISAVLVAAGVTMIVIGDEPPGSTEGGDEGTDAGVSEVRVGLAPISGSNDLGVRGGLIGVSGRF